MKSTLIVVTSACLSLLSGCGLATYNGWAVNGAKERAIAADADCTQKASNGFFKTGSEWAACYISMGQQFASSISLNRADLLQTYEINIRQLEATFDEGKISGQQFHQGGRAAFDTFWQNIQRVELAHQRPDYDFMLAGMSALAQGAAQAQQPSVQPSLMSVVPRRQSTSQVQTLSQTSAAHSPLTSDPDSVNCTSLVTGALISTQCQPR